MPVYQLPRLQELVRWSPDAPRTCLRFVAQGGLVLLHASVEPALSVQAWLTLPLQLALLGCAPEAFPKAAPGPPVLCVKLGEWPAIAAPACIFELREPRAIYAWANARPRPAELRLLLLRLDPAHPGQARVEASRRVWSPGWVYGDELLRRRLEQQYLETEDEQAGQVQHAGHQLLACVPAPALLRRAHFRVSEPGGPVLLPGGVLTRSTR